MERYKKLVEKSSKYKDLKRYVYEAQYKDRKINKRLKI